MLINKSGSVILVVLCTLTAVMIVCTKQWFRLSMLIETIALREDSEKKVRLTEALLNHGIVLCQDNYSHILDELETQKEIIGSIYPWPPIDMGYKGLYTGMIIITKEDKHLILKALITNNNTTMYTISCTITQQKDQCVIGSWHRE